MRGTQERHELSGYILRLTHALYRVTDLLPREEPLRRNAREKANEFLILGIGIAQRGIEDGEAEKMRIATEIICGFFTLARTLNCANPMNFLVLEREYRLLAEDLVARPKAALSPIMPPAEIQPPMPEAEDRAKAKENAARSLVAGESKIDAEVHPVRNNPDLSQDAVLQKAEWISNGVNERQRKIMERLAGLGRVKISDFYGIFGDISSKTIQRDLQDLTTRNIIKKEGEKRWTMYTLVEMTDR